MSHFVSILLLALALTLTVCFGVAAWRQSEGRDVDITATIPHPAIRLENEAEPLKNPAPVFLPAWRTSY
ncbi:hypothetical protein [Bradyrhizobium sp. LA7.1]|uniref:hypothetical protein n=1 Tax=Bradyrhizobium sp. LA7.1 TaxID=3156324 RepID=UPI003390DBF7